MESIITVFFLIALFLLIGTSYKAFFIAILCSMFLENSFFWIKESIILPFNIRPIYIISFISIVYLIPQLILKINSKFVFLRHHKILLAYYLYCTGMLILVPTYNSIEHFGQISIGVFLYFSFIILAKKNDIKMLYQVLLLVGSAQLFLGSLQIIFGILTVENIINLEQYVQHLDLVRYGRPFGSLVEPDFFGAIATFFTFIFIGEYLTTRKNLFYFIGLLFALLLLYSGVRASILGFLASLILVLSILRDRVRISRIDGIIGIYASILLIPIFYSTIQRFAYFFRLDFWSEGFMNPRVLQMGVSSSQFLENPIFGNGLNAYRFLGESYEDAIESWMPDWVISGYDPSIITSLLNDTGIIGFTIFVMFLFYYFRNLLFIKNFRNVFMFGGISSLFISYIFTNGLPFTFTWILLAMTELVTNSRNGFSDEI